MSARVVFLGTPLFAVPSLDALGRLAERGVLEIAAVVTQPDRRGDRGRIAVPPVKERALALSLPVLQPGRFERASIAELTRLDPDLLVWSAYGNLIPRALLEAVNGRAVNVHASLLPRWRGAAPVARAIIAGDHETGVTLMEGTAELDAGPILAQERTAIGDTEDAGALTARLGLMGAALLERELPRYVAGALSGHAQDEALAMYAPKMTTADGALDFARPAEELARRVRACTPDPGAFTMFRGQRLVVTTASVTGGTPVEHGVVRVRDGLPHVAAGAGWLRLDAVRRAGKRTMTGAEWARGTRGLDGVRVPS